ncbi:uncharacterized protein BO96DRAFT_132957 [Aspergillus niger CBS 101883]|uniref:uncharacterized protein n=1 Tax=Aspergillus lacticoffeatus (strain CBS 101883) TaxID=1450533 RepID=UPI000D7EC39B|nr:uncharacterized protein BO96DRAFT_132957 [Aspergillus niger CBS 101883]PYH53057.1 hypothetical protein BO96DRAFT_132957 [Aspergillus niger CBS 101883]
MALGFGTPVLCIAGPPFSTDILGVCSLPVKRERESRVLSPGIFRSLIAFPSTVPWFQRAALLIVNLEMEFSHASSRDSLVEFSETTPHSVCLLETSDGIPNPLPRSKPTYCDGLLQAYTKKRSSPELGLTAVTSWSLGSPSDPGVWALRRLWMIPTLSEF